jgi:hypothetical protein
MRSDLVNIYRLVQHYINNLRPTTFSDRADWTLHVSRSAQITDKPTAVPIVAIFGWHYLLTLLVSFQRFLIYSDQVDPNLAWLKTTLDYTAITITCGSSVTK